MAEYQIPGTAQIRKLGSVLSSVELLELCANMADEGLDKKIWSVLSRVYEEKKTLDVPVNDEICANVKRIIDSDIASSLKLQTFTSFKLPSELIPDIEKVKNLIVDCDTKRGNIAAHFVNLYALEKEVYEQIKRRTDILTTLFKILPIDRLLDYYEVVFMNENKETITGAIRLVGKCKKNFEYNGANLEKIKTLTDKAFETKEVFFTSKLLFCQTFMVPKSAVISQRTLDKILKISINYEEKMTKDFVAYYNLHFDCSDYALCQYYIANKKASNQKGIVLKFAQHLVRIKDEETKRRLLRGAFKHGGYFRMYAGCMQDGYIDMNKMRRFHYSDEDVEWCSNLPGLKK